MNTEKKMMTEKKPCFALACASDIILMYSKKIHSYVGPCKLYLLVKDMKLENTDVNSIKFIGNVPRVDMRQYVERRPNVTTVITDSYGPSCLYWKAFDTVRTNLTSFVVRSENNGLVDMYVRVSINASPEPYDYCDHRAILTAEDTMTVVLNAARLGDKETVYLYSKYGNSTMLCKDKLSHEFCFIPNHPRSDTIRVCVHKLCLINSTPHVAEDRYFRIILKRTVIGENNGQVTLGYRITKISDVCDSKPCAFCFRQSYFN